MAGFLNSISRGGDEYRERVNPKFPRDPALATLFGDLDGVNVTPESAMRVTAVYACVSLISETLAGLPLHVYQKVGNDRNRAETHPIYRLLHDMPTAGLTSFEWREIMFSHTALRGDGYARIVTRPDGSIRELPLIMPTHIEPFRDTKGRIAYRWIPDGVGPVKVLFDDEVLRIPHKMLDGLHSMSPITTHKATIGNAMAANKFLSAFYKNSASPKGALVTPELLNDEAAKLLREKWEQRHMGPNNAGRIAIFDGGMKWENIGMTMDDAQYLELQAFSVTDIARIYLVPPHKIGELSNATFSNIEHQAIAFVSDTILRWVRRAEQRFNAYLLSEADRLMGYYIAFDLNGLLRGDSTARANFYRALFYVGAISPNEIRNREDMNPYQGGERFYVQGATTPIDALDAMTGANGGANSLDAAVRAIADAAIQQAIERIEQERAQNAA
jgi:HK97 family phage portal protein